MSLQFLFFILVLFVATAATACGWVAVVRIRNSNGKLHGLGLALFAALVFPMLLVDAVILAALAFGMNMFLTLGLSSSNYFCIMGLKETFNITMILAVTLAVWLDVVVVKRIWRAVNAPLAPAGHSKPTPSTASSQANPRKKPRLPITILIHTVMLCLLAMNFAHFKPVGPDNYLILGIRDPKAFPFFTQAAFAIGDFLRHGGFVFVLLLAAANAGICWLAQRTGGTKLLKAWGTAFIVGVCGFALLCTISVSQSVQKAVDAQEKQLFGGASHLETKPDASAWPAGVEVKPDATTPHPFTPRFPQPAHPISSDNRIPLPRDTDVRVEIRTKRVGVNEESTLVQALTFRVAPDRDSGFILRGDVKAAGGQACNRWTADLVDPDTGLSFRHIESDFGKPMTYTAPANTRTPRTFYLRGRNLATTCNYPEENRIELLQAEDPADPTAIPFEVYAIAKTGRDVGAPEFRMVSMAAARNPFGPSQDQSWEIDPSGNTEVFSIETGLPTNQGPGLSLYYDSTKRSVELRGCNGMAVMKTDNRQWDSFSDFPALGVLQNKPNSIERSSAPGDKTGFPQTFLFRSLDREIGILQVVEAEERPPRLKIRYKTMSSVWPAGVEVKLLAVNSRCAQAGWWEPNGFPAWLPPFENPEIGQLTGNDKAMVRYFAFDLAGIPATTPILYLAGESDAGPFEQFADLDTGVAITDEGTKFLHPRQHRCAALVPVQAKKATVRVGIPFGRWETAGIFDKTGMISCVPRQPTTPVSIKVEAKAGGGTSILVDMDSDNYEYRIVCETLDGQQFIDTNHCPSVSRSSRPDNQAGYSYRWDLGNLVPLERIRGFRLLVRPYHWTVFHDVALQPANAEASLPKKPGPGAAETPPSRLERNLQPEVPAPTFESVTAEVTRVVQKYKPGAKIESKPNFLTIACDQQEFVIHKPIGKAGPDVVGTDTYKTTGPSATGFTLCIHQISRPYRGQAVLVQVTHEPYWTTFDNYGYDPKSQHTILTSFSFGSRLDPELKKELLEILKFGSQRDFGL